MIDDQDYFDYFPDQLGLSGQPTGRQSYSWWSDPDTDPPAWMLDPRTPPIGATPGQFWNWAGDHWEMKNAPTAGPTSTPTRMGGDTPPPVIGGDNGPRTGGGDWGYLTEPFTGTAPSWQSFNPLQSPTLPKPPKFEYKEFQAPTLDSVYADPSYQFRKGEGEKALAQRIASTGAYRTGGTLKDFINYNQNAASQEYGNIFGRAVDTHNLGLSQALGTYGTNWGVDRDLLDREIDIWGAKNTTMQRENENVNRRNLDSFLSEFDIFDRNRKRAADMLFGGAGLGG